MKKKYFLNANIIDPKNSLNELGQIEKSGPEITKENVGDIQIFNCQNKIAICGDILHSRVARSNIYLLNMLGAEVNIIAPTNLMPKEIEKFGVNVFTDMKKGLKDCDIVMMLRLQNERMTSSFLSSNREYYEYYGLTPDKLEFAKSDALIMHPGPMNRGIEIDTKLADDINKSVIKEQVELGVAVRMACLKLFCE